MLLQLGYSVRLLICYVKDEFRYEKTAKYSNLFVCLVVIVYVLDF